MGALKDGGGDGRETSRARGARDELTARDEHRRPDERDARDSRAVAITGRGVVCSVGRSVAELARALREGRSGIRAIEARAKHAPKVAATLAGAGGVTGARFEWQAQLEAEAPGMWPRARKILNNATDSTRVGVLAAVQAFREAGWDALGDDEAALERTGLVVAGSNVSQDYVAHNMRQVATGAAINPKYAVSYSDSNQVGCCSEILGIRGPGSTVGAASASGNAALFQAWHWVRSGIVDRCVVLGASTAFSAAELEGFSVIGAASLEDDPARACRPFDRGHSGFVWGEGAAAVVLENEASVRARGAAVHGWLMGASLLLDARHGPEPSAPAEARAMRAALNAAGVTAAEVDYINAHGTGSPPGDRAECEALRAVFGAPGARVRINSTKPIVGHCMSSAGIVELLACLLQMENGFLHGNINLEQPIDDQLSFVGVQAETAAVRVAMSNGFGFGGFNTSIVIGNTSAL